MGRGVPSVPSSSEAGHTCASTSRTPRLSSFHRAYLPFHDLHPMPWALLRAPTPKCSKVRNGWHMHALNWPLEGGA